MIHIINCLRNSFVETNDMKNTPLIACCLLIFTTIAFGQTTVSTAVDSTDFPFSDDLIFDSSGNLYCADYSGDAVYKRTPSGTLTEFASGFNTPNGLAFDSFGNLFVCDNVGDAIYKLDGTGAFLDTFTVTYPSGIIKDMASDTMIFTTYGAQSHLKKLAPNGTVVDFHSGAPLNGPVGLAYCQGELYVANFSNRMIYQVEPDSLIFIAQLPGSGSLGFLSTLGNSLVATAFTGHKIYTVNVSNGSVVHYAGSSAGSVDGPIETAKFITPNGIVLNSTQDTMYISEYNSKNLRMITGFTAGVEEVIPNVKITVFPNPAKEVLYIDGAVAPFSVRITNANGECVFEQKENQGTNSEFQIGHLSSGSYWLTIRSVNVETTTPLVKAE